MERCTEGANTGGGGFGLSGIYVKRGPELKTKGIPDEGPSLRMSKSSLDTFSKSSLHVHQR